MGLFTLGYERSSNLSITASLVYAHPLVLHNRSEGIFKTTTK